MNSYAMGGFDERKGLDSALLSDDQQGGLDKWVTCIDGTEHYLPFPGRPPIEFPICSDPRTLRRCIALHWLIVAEKP